MNPRQTLPSEWISKLIFPSSKVSWCEDAFYRLLVFWAVKFCPASVAVVYALEFGYVAGFVVVHGVIGSTRVSAIFLPLGLRNSTWLG